MPLPKCINIGCDNEVAVRQGTKEKPIAIRNVCRKCHEASYKGLTLPNITPVKKPYCQNQDARLGFPCTTSIMYPGQLELDHIDGNCYNNIPSNTQTLCKDCHCYKSHINGDYKRRR